MPLSRLQLWQLLEEYEPVVSKLLLDCYQHEGYWQWKNGGQGPHEQHWHTGFHASNFPGEDPLACGRFAVYGLLDPPRAGMIKPFLRAWFDLGTNLEHDWVRRFASYGTLLSANVARGDQYQTTFEDEDCWLTGSCDAIVLPRGWHKGHVVEIKTTSHQKVLEMLARDPKFPKDHGKYIRQLKTYIGLAHELPYAPTVNLCDESGAIVPMAQPCPHHGQQCAFTTTTLLPPDDGELIYSSREEPLTVVSFHVAYDPEHMRAGRERLAQWREYFQQNKIPPHPLEKQRAKWTVAPCQYCEMKPFCKLDYQQGVEDLEKSNLIEFASKIRPDYDFEAKRSAVLFRWLADTVADVEQQEEMAT
jgi:hypothetical protein